MDRYARVGKLEKDLELGGGEALYSGLSYSKTDEASFASQLDLDLNAAYKPEQAKWFFEGNDIPSREIEDEAAPRREQGAPRLGRHRRRSRDYVRTPAVPHAAAAAAAAGRGVVGPGNHLVGRLSKSAEAGKATDPVRSLKC
ncbi:hypothetical protein NL676_007083 [Syzygium grande]|nr:hypothetical protein NL676_007083 [Syzygium grande]